MGRFLEGAVKRSLLFTFRIWWSRPVEPSIAGRFRPELRSALLHCFAGIGDRRHFLIVDDNLVGGVLRRSRAFRHNHSHRFTHMHHSHLGKRRTMRRNRGLAAASRNWMTVRDRLVMRVTEISRGPPPNDARRSFGRGNINARNLGEGMRRTHEVSGKRAVGSDVVAETALSAQQGIVFDTSFPGVVVSSGCWLTHALLREDVKACDR